MLSYASINLSEAFLFSTHLKKETSMYIQKAQIIHYSLQKDAVIAK